MKDRIKIDNVERITKLLKEDMYEEYMSRRNKLSKIEMDYENRRLIHYLSQRLNDCKDMEEVLYYNSVLNLVSVQNYIENDELRHRIDLSLSYLLKDTLG